MKIVRFTVDVFVPDSAEKDEDYKSLLKEGIEDCFENVSIVKSEEVYNSDNVKIDITTNPQPYPYYPQPKITHYDTLKHYISYDNPMSHAQVGDVVNIGGMNAIKLDNAHCGDIVKDAQGRDIMLCGCHDEANREDTSADKPYCYKPTDK